MASHFWRATVRGSRHEKRTTEFFSASKPPSYMMDGMTDRPTKISFGEMRDSGVWAPDPLR